MAYLIIWQKNNKFLVLMNHKYKEPEDIKCVQSYLKSHLLWVTLYLFYTSILFYYNIK